jgi:hypothetical protein
VGRHVHRVAILTRDLLYRIRDRRNVSYSKKNERVTHLQTEMVAVDWLETAGLVWMMRKGGAYQLIGHGGSGVGGGEDAVESKLLR